MKRYVHEHGWKHDQAASWLRFPDDVWAPFPGHVCAARVARHVRHRRFPVIPLFQTTLISVLTDAERFDRIFYLALE